VQAHVLEHFRVQEVLIDCRQFLLKRLVEVRNDLRVTLHQKLRLEWVPQEWPAA